MSRFQLATALSKNSMAALSANAPCYSTTTQSVIDKMKNIFPHPATASKQAATSAENRKANQGIKNAAELPKEKYVNADDSMKIVSEGGGGDPSGNCGFVDTEVMRTTPHAYSGAPQTASTTDRVVQNR